MATTEFTTAPAGSGKTYRRCAHYLATEWLPHNDGMIITNYPINVEKMVAYVLFQNPKLTADSVRNKIHIIPREVLATWAAERSGPWEYLKSGCFSDGSLPGALIAIDEIHNYLGTSSSKGYVNQWKIFLGELRHQHIQFEALSQNEGKVHKGLKDEAGLKRRLYNAETRLDPVCAIPMSDWYNVRAKFFTGTYTAAIFEQDYEPIFGKWKLRKETKFNLKPEFFELYDSYSAPESQSNHKKQEVALLPYQRFSKVGLLFWFVRRNVFSLLTRTALIVFLVWIFPLGGSTTVMKMWLGSFQTGMAKPLNDAPIAVSSASSASLIAPPVVSASVAELAKVILDLKEKIKSLENDRRFAADIVGFFGNDVILSDGLTYSVGDTILTGPLNGKKIYEISLKRRCLIFTDSSVVRMR